MAKRNVRKLLLLAFSLSAFPISGYSYTAIEQLQSVSDGRFHKDGRLAENIVFNETSVPFRKVDEFHIMNGAQDHIVQGRVTNSLGDPLPGVNVLIEGTTRGTATNVDGEYRIEGVPDNSTLVFSYIGYVTQKVNVGLREQINVQMVEHSIGLEEIVVIGYGEQTRTDLTGSVSTISSSEIEDIPGATIDQMMDGLASGVQIQQVSGAPGAGTSVKIRGAGSLGAGNDPLYVIDGIPYSSGANFVVNPLIYLNPNDIESISILKDASSTAIYGSRGANGVIIITTKKGSFNEKVQVNFSLKTGIQHVPEKGRPEMMNAREFALLQQELVNKRVREFESREATPDDYPVEYRFPDELGDGYNFYDMLLQKAPVHDLNVNLTKGTENSRMNFSLGYYKQEGVVRHTGIERFSGKLTGELNIGNDVKVGFSLMPTFIKQDRADVQGNNNFGRTSVIGTALWANPVVSPYDENGNLVPFLQSPQGKYSSPWSMANPLFVLRESITTQNAFSNIGSTSIEWEIIPNLKFKSQLSTVWSNSDVFQYVPSTIGGINSPPTPGTGYSITTDNTSFNWLIENTLNYRKSFGDHAFEGLLGYTTQQQTGRGKNLRADPYSNDLIHTINAAQSIRSWGENFNQWALISYLGRINYNFKGKYFLTSTLRSDGSSRFGSKRRFAVFPSVAAAWRISEEGFWNEGAVIDNMKLRASYGTGGNNNIGNYRHIANISAGSYVFGDKQVTASYVGLNNPYLTWEESKQIDLGFDLDLFKERLSLVFDVYEKTTKNMLFDEMIPAITGFNTQITNQGSIRNRGMEIALNGQPFVGPFSWNVGLNVAFNKNKVLELNKDSDRLLSGNNWGYPTHVTYEGAPMTQFFGWKLLGLLTEEDMMDPSVPKDNLAEVGGNKYQDIDGDGVITNILDYVPIGTPWPDYTFGITNNFSYKRFNLSIVANGQVGGNVVDARRSETDFTWGRTNLRKEWVNRWVSPEQPGDGKHGVVSVAGNDNTWIVSSMWIEDASFFRISGLTLSYTLPQIGAKGFQDSKIDMYFTIHNLITLTRYRGSNPEAQSFGVSSTLAPGWDSAPYPLSRSFLLGVNFRL